MGKKYKKLGFSLKFLIKTFWKIQPCNFFRNVDCKYHAKFQMGKNPLKMGDFPEISYKILFSRKMLPSVWLPNIDSELNAKFQKNR